jgi:transposase
MENELEVNNRRLSPKEQETLRLRIVRVAKKNLRANGNVKARVVAEICECSVSHVSHTWKKYRESGVSGLKCVSMGRPPSSGKLTAGQQTQVRGLIVDKTPDQLKLPGFLWDRENVRGLIRRLFGVSLALQNISVYLRKWGMSPQRPIQRSYKQNPERIKKWLDEEFPAIKARAKSENAEIAWGDETGCQNETNYVKGYAPIGQTPVLPVGNEPFRVSMISAITNQGKVRFMFYRDAMNAGKLIEFLRRLVAGAKRKIHLILDNLKVHHAKRVKEWLEKHKDEIELFFLPPYAPQHNPDEYLNGNLKRELARKGYSRTVDELESKARSVMKRFQNDEARVARFFQAEPVKYAS